MSTPGLLSLRNAVLADTSSGGEFLITRDAALVIVDGLIAWIGADDQLDANARGSEPIDLQGRFVTPGLIDCHTHLIYAGNRVGEFEARLRGADYATIAARGGGINSTVAATRAASSAELAQAARHRLERMAANGVTTIEIKSGYGLELSCEARILQVARSLCGEFGVDVRTTFLGAHALAPEFNGDKTAYLQYATRVMMPSLARAGLIDMVDAFCETIAFSPTELVDYFDQAKHLGLPIKAHVDQLSDTGLTSMMTRHSAISVDHLEFLSDDSIAALGASSTVAVVLPGANYFLGESKMPPIAKMRAAGVPIAIATDHNPGTCPMESILLAMNMACVRFSMTPAEALRGVTRNGAKALGLADRGEIAVGKRADLAIWNISDPAELAYNIGMTPLWARVSKGDIFHANQT